MSSKHEEVNSKNITTAKLLGEYVSSFNNDYISATDNAKHLSSQEINKFVSNYEIVVNDENTAKIVNDKNIDSRQYLYENDYIEKKRKIFAGIEIYPFDEKTTHRISNIKKEMRGEALTISNVDKEKQHSKSHLSYDNKAALFETLVSVLFENRFKPVVAELEEENLRSFVDILKRANVNVALSNKELSEKSNERKIQTEKLTELIKGVKNLVKIIYGLNSNEYTLISKLKVY